MNMKSEYFNNNLKGVKLNRKECFTCRSCGKVLDTKSDLDIHCEKHHENIQCQECPYVSFGRTDLKNHLKRKHKSETS